jgi:hypothetical protein
VAPRSTRARGYDVRSALAPGWLSDERPDTLLVGLRVGTFLLTGDAG